MTIVVCYTKKAALAAFFISCNIRQISLFFCANAYYLPVVYEAASALDTAYSYSLVVVYVVLKENGVVIDIHCLEIHRLCLIHQQLR